ncbi:MAG: ABC transporter substrate-binding protein, partial [Treponema sp.]|nr:ABC transporter substrate-binding protein [Treponema sp.]
MSGKYRLGIIIFALLLTACSEKTIPLSMNSSGYLPQVNRIISAAPSITEIIIGLELAGNLIAVDKYSLNIEGVRKELPEIDFFYPDIEAIANLKPDI